MADRLYTDVEPDAPPPSPQAEQPQECVCSCKCTSEASAVNLGSTSANVKGTSPGNG